MLDGINTLIDIKHKNVKSIIDEIRFSENATKRELAEKLNLSFATVSNTCNSLLAMGLIAPIGDRPERGGVGRMPQYVELNRGRLHIVGLSLQMSGEIHLALVDLANRIVGEKIYFYDYAGLGGFDRLVRICAEKFDEFLEYAGIAGREGIIGVGVAVSGIFDRATENIVASELPVLENRPLKAMLESALGKSIFVDNDINLSALAAANAASTDNIVYVYIGEGLGIGVMNQGTIVRGERGYGSEICHMPIGRRPVPCHLCGCPGCLQSDVSFEGFLAKYHGEKKLRSGKVPALWKRFMAGVGSGEGRALAVVEENAELLGKALSVVVNLFTPGRIVVGGIDRVLFNLMEPVILDSVNRRKTVLSFRPYALSYDPDYKANIIRGAAESVYRRWCPDIDGSTGEMAEGSSLRLGC